MIIVTKHFCKDEEFYDYLESFTIWESILLCVWSLFTFAGYFSTLCCKVYEFVQTLAKRKLDQSHKKPLSYVHVQTNLPPESYKLAYTQNLKLEFWSKKMCN